MFDYCSCVFSIYVDLYLWVPLSWLVAQAVVGRMLTIENETGMAICNFDMQHSTNTCLDHHLEMLNKLTYVRYMYLISGKLVLVCSSFVES